MNAKHGWMLVGSILGLGVALGCAQRNAGDMMQPPPRAAELDQLDPMVGAWVEEWEMPGKDGKMEKATGTSTTTWEVGRTVLVERFEAAASGSMPAMSAMGIWTWDARSKRFKTFWCDTLGETGHGEMRYDAKTATWRGTGSGRNAYTGETKAFEGTLKFIDKNTVEWTHTEWDAWKLSKKLEMKGTSKRK